MSDEHGTDGEAQMPESEREVLRTLVRRVFDEHKSASDEAVLRPLYLLGRGSGSNAEDFRRTCVEEGLEGSRASEIKILLEDEDIGEKFVSGALTWDQALESARNRKPGRLEQVLCKLLRQLYRAGHQWPQGGSANGWRLLRDNRGQAQFIGPWGSVEVVRLVADQEP